MEFFEWKKIFLMKKGIQTLYYSRHLEATKHRNETRQYWIKISEEQYQTTYGIILNKYENSRFSFNDTVMTSDHLIKGNIVRVNNTKLLGGSSIWDYIIHSESRKGLEKFAKILKLPLE